MRPSLGAGGRRRAVAAIAGGAVAAALACSAIVEHGDSQCATNADCARFPQTVCAQGGCVPYEAPDAGAPDAALPPNAPCTTTQDCLPQHGGHGWICLRSDATCVPLLSQDCTEVIGEPTSDDAVIVGALLPLGGPHASTGAALSAAIRLAVGDFVGGLPSITDGGLPRPIAVVLCDESANVDRAAGHLYTDLALPVILGAGESASTLVVAHDVTSKAQQVLMSPRATLDLSAYFGTGFVWRTVPSYALEAAAITSLVEQRVAPAIAAKYALSTVHVAIVRAKNTESTELDAVIAPSLEAIADAGADADADADAAGDADVAADAGADAGPFVSVVDIDFGDPDDPTNTDPTVKYDDAINAVTLSATPPDIVILLGETQAVTHVLGGIESNWPAGAHLPQYVVSSGLQTAELLALVGATPSLRTRILGTAAGSDSASYKDLSKFLVRFRQTFPEAGAVPETFGVAQAYDAFYTIAYAASVTRNTDLNGVDIKGVLRAMLALDGGPRTTIDVGPDQIGAAFSALAAGGRLSLQGASAPLAFDPQSGDIVTDIQVWCILPGQGSAPLLFQSSGLAYSSDAGVLQGSILGACLN